MGSQRMLWIVRTGSFIGVRYFANEDDAQEAADRLTAISGRKWVVDCIITANVID